MTERIQDEELYRIDPNALDDDFDDPADMDEDAAGQQIAENEQEHPRTIIQKVTNAVEDMVPGDSDNDGH